METRDDYPARLRQHISQPWFDRLPPESQRFIREKASIHRLSFQEVKIACEAALDLDMWGEKPLASWWTEQEAEGPRMTKAVLFERLKSWLQELKESPKSYPDGGMNPPRPVPLEVISKERPNNIVGMCPVASEDTVCCNLRTIDAVENCGFGCSYCTIQTFYDDRVVIDSRLAEKLEKLELDPSRLYHFGTGQSSDSLMWGNQKGLLDRLSDFAARHPKVLLELKTKSKNVAYFLDRTTPPNLVPSWSMNTPTIIRNEEHFTASLPERLSAARRVADRGVLIAFHFHPLVYYENWDRDYIDVVNRITSGFDEEEVLFVSFGSVTFIKPVIRAIRERGRPTKMLQMELVPGPKGKLSYPDSIKEEMFSSVYQAFSSWHGKVFMYLCMEKGSLWKSTFGFVYPSNEAFETDFLGKVFSKIDRHRPPEEKNAKAQRRKGAKPETE
jgi:spore photoproduct lyase